MNNKSKRKSLQESATIYKIGTKKGIIFKIDKNYLENILIYKESENTLTTLNWDYYSRNKKFIVSNFNNGEINILNYIMKDYTNLGNKKCKFVFINDDYYDFRLKNIKKIPIISNSINSIKINTKPEYFINTDNINIVENVEGHKKNYGINANKERNNYKIIEQMNIDGTVNKYYEISLGKFDKDNNEFTFIIDEEDKSILENIYLFNNNFIYNIDNLNEEEKLNIITYKEPTWALLENQYVACSITVKNIGKETVYVHRLICGCQKDDNKTVDHINGNKFDNRKSNLRIVNMTIQNQNRNNVKRSSTLNDILNPENKPNIPLLSFDNLKFICFRKEDGEYFDIEFKPGRALTEKSLKYHSTKAVLFKDDKYKSLRIKLCHAICIRYLISLKYPSIIKEKIDNQKYQSIEEFQTYSNSLISEVMGISYTIDSFIDYMLTLKIPKFVDPRINKTVATTQNNINDIKFTYLQYNTERDKYNVEFVANKEKTPSIKYKIDGCGCKNITTVDKKAYALVQRYNLFITLENDINKKLYHNNNTNTNNTTESTSDNVQDPIFPDNINKNVSNLKSLTDYQFENEKFKSFTDFKTYTELCINKLLNTQIISDTQNNDQTLPISEFTMETFTAYVNKKANNKKVDLKILSLEYPNYPILTS